LAMGAGAFGVGETDHCFGAGQVIIESLGLAREKHIALGVEDERGAGDLFGYAIAEMVFEDFGHAGSRRGGAEDEHSVREFPSGCG
jgi:hypothetical protein